MGLRLCALRRATEHHTQPVNDIQIRSLGYDRRRGRLEIEFTWTDDVRQFYPVAPALYRQLLAAKPMYLFLKRILELRGVRFQYRALAYMEAGRGELISRNGNTFRGSADLATWIAEHLRVEVRYSTARLLASMRAAGPCSVICSSAAVNAYSSHLICYTSTAKTCGYCHSSKMDLEGIVCKRKDSPYKVTDKRHWIKVKNSRYSQLD
jgi:KTSC domain